MAQVVVHSNFAPSTLFLFSAFPCCKRYRIKHILFQVCVFMIPKRINQQSQILEAFKIIILVKSFNNVLPQGNFIGPPITFIHETQLFLWLEWNPALLWSPKSNKITPVLNYPTKQIKTFENVQNNGCPIYIYIYVFFHEELPMYECVPNTLVYKNKQTNEWNIPSQSSYYLWETFDKKKIQKP